MTGLAVTFLALALALAFSGTANYWTVVAWLSLIIVVLLFFIGRALLGGNATWKREYLSQPDNRFQLALDFKGLPALRLSRVPRAFTCVVDGPDGVSREADHIWGGGDKVYCLYPDTFTGAPAITAGTYLVTWKEQDPAGTGKWRLMDVGKLSVP